MDRRRFLALGGISAAALTVPAAVGWPRPPSPPENLARPDLLSMLDDRNQVRELGRRYRSMVPEEDGREPLAKALKGELRPGSSTGREARLEEKIRADFAAGRTVTLKGWVLSRTEARQCALFSLT